MASTTASRITPTVTGAVSVTETVCGELASA